MQNIKETTENDQTKKETTNYKVIVAQEPDFVKLYLNTLLVFKDLPKQLSKTLLALIKRMGYADPDCKHGGQLIPLNSYNKQQICESLNIKMNTLDQNLTNLVKAGILKRVGYGTYQANPNMFGRGEWLDIKAIKATFDFKAGTVEAEIKTEPEEPGE